MSRFKRRNAPTLPATRTPARVPYSNERQPDVSPREQIVEPEARRIRPFVVSQYDAKPLNADMFYESFTGVANPADESISLAASNLVFGDSTEGVIVPTQRRYVIRGIDIGFFSGFPNFYNDTPYGIAPGFASAASFGASWSITVNGNPVPGFANRAVVGGPGVLAHVNTWILVEENSRISVTLQFIGDELGQQHAAYGALWGDDLLTSNINLPFAPTNIEPIAVEG